MSIEQHIRSRQIELGRKICPRRKIYLDARFWIFMRDAALGVRCDTASQALLAHLRRGVTEGSLLCPISSAMFLELMKQPYSPGRRVGTARVIDELSMGIGLIEPHTVLGTEIYTFLLKGKGGIELFPIEELMWTKVANILGPSIPTLAGRPLDEELAIQKAFHDYLWNLSLNEMVEIFGDKPFGPNDFVELAAQTNDMNALHKGELGSFAQTYDIELRGSIELAGEVTADIMHELAEKQAARSLSRTPEERATSVNVCRNALYLAFEKPETRRILRSIHIGASLHAAIRWDKSRKFKPNDYYDFQHAVAALSYCDAFLTEGPLHTLVRQPHTNLESINGCRVFSDIGVAADFVETLLK
ncbi:MULTISPECIES: hypothetical protein [Burkholderiaceae]|uniref:Uncharacterized protein n=1 Tax=Caballeronia zhejiangensis TaxID=871203 RepID=A0A656Q8S5_9BURK|nr:MULTISPECIES: hypothetical protein [Burkholderiaceae]KAK42451.1 hypothetical protein BG58_41745 [Caballeronia jiangsuensis]KDR24689.1 hypothetical protein BG60_35750 [Caballeronia zhejiangensis]KWU19255.1 hypothetical protein AS149_13555 [Burkholderia cenocepacia]